MINHYGLKESTRLLADLRMEGIESVGLLHKGFSFYSLNKALHLQTIGEQMKLWREHTSSDERTKVLEQHMKRHSKQQLEPALLAKDTQLFSNLMEVPNNYQL